MTPRSRLRFHLPLDGARLLRARGRIRDYLHHHLVAQDEIEGVVQAMEEAMTNSVRHSGACDDMLVELQFVAQDLIVDVKDHGVGFQVGAVDWQARPDPLALGGRGLFMMRDLMDELTLRVDGGLEVRMVKRGLVPAVATAATGNGHRSRAARPDYLEARRLAMLEEIEEGFFDLDWEYRVVYMNRAAEGAFGIPREEVLGRVLWEVWPVASDHDTGRRCRAAMELGENSIGEVHSGLTGLWLELRIYPTTSGLCVYAREIGARKRKEAERDQYLGALRDSEQRLRLHVEHSPMGVVEWSTEFVITRWAGEAQRIFGWNEEEALGRHIMDLRMIHEDDVPAVQRTMVRLTDGSSPHVVSSNRNCTKDGRVIECTWYNSVVSDADGRMISVMSLVLDETQRKLAEARKTLQNRVLEGTRTILETALDSGSDEDLGRACLEVAAAISGSRIGFIAEIGDDGLLRDVAISDSGWQACALSEAARRGPFAGGVPHGLYGAAMARGETLLTNSPADHPASAGVPDGHPPLTAFLGVPLVKAGRVVGVLGVGNREGGYGDDERFALEGLAPAIVQAFESKRAKAAAEARSVEVSLAHERLAAALSTIDEALFILDRQGRVAFANRNALERWGCDETVLGTSYRNVCPGDAGAVAEANRRRALEEGRPVAFGVQDPHTGLWYEERDYPCPEGVTVVWSPAAAEPSAVMRAVWE